MKKIIISIMLALMGLSSYGLTATSCSECEATPAKETSWVYNWKFTGKTTYGTKAPSSKNKSSPCCSIETQTCSTVRAPASLKIEGYTYYCSPGCGTDSFAIPLEANEIFWSEKPGRFSIGKGVKIDICNIIGKKADKCEVGGTTEFVANDATYIITFSGIGTYSKKDGLIKSASGNFSGYAIPCVCAYAAYWDCETLLLNCVDFKYTVVYGKWSVKYDKKATKKYLKNGTTAKIPDWVEWVNRKETDESK